MGIMKFIGLFLVVFFTFNITLFAQPGEVDIETRNGKKYYVHVVQAGNTLYGIHKLYNTPLEDILNSNEGLSDNLTIGQKVYIPIPTNNQSFYGKHIVKDGETLYGISKQYKCSVDDLMNLNDGLSSGIKPGQEIIVPSESNNGSEGVTKDPVTNNNIVENIQPAYEVSITDSIVKHTVLDHETLYSISKRYMVSMDTIRTLNNIKNNKIKPGQILEIPIKKVDYEILEKDVNQLVQIGDSSLIYQPVLNKKPTYKVALVMPFMFSQNDAAMSKPLKVGEDREIMPLTKVCFEFYQGFKLAADSLAKAGLNVQIIIIDTKNDSNEVKRQLANQNELDLIVGPLYEKCIDVTSRYAKENGINMVIPFKNNAENLKNNEHVFATVTSNMTLFDGVVDYVVAHHYMHKVIVMKPQYGDMTIYDRVRERYNEKIKSMPNAYSSQIVDVDMGSSSGRDLNLFIAKDSVNIVIVPSTDVKIVSGALNRLNKVMNMNHRAKNMKIIVFGIEEWNNLADLDILHKVRLNHHYATYRHTNLNAGRGLKMLRSFRSKFGIDPSVYAVQGFDVGLYFLSALKLYGTEFQHFLPQHEIALVQNKFNFKQITPGSGYENQGIKIVRFAGYQLVELQ